MNITRERVRQLQVKAINKIRKIVENEGLDQQDLSGD